MGVLLEDPAREVKRLERCINDLIGLLALPAKWSTEDPAQILDVLMDAVLRMLSLDFFYARLENPSPLEVFRTAESCNSQVTSQDIGVVVSHWLGGDGCKPLSSTRVRFGDKGVSLFPTLLGIHGEIGIIVAGCERADFPNQSESLLLSVAANQASIGLREARVEDRKRAEEALKASEREFGLIINTIPALAWSAGPDGSAEFFNQHYLAYVGLPLQQLQGSGWTVALHPDDLSSVAGVWRSLLATGKPGEAEARLRRFDGEYRWFLLRASPMLDESGSILKWYGTNTDIDDRKRAEEKLRRSEAFLSEGQRLSLSGSYSWKVASNEITWSEQLYRIYEFDVSVPVTPELIRTRVHPEDCTLFEIMVQQEREERDHFEWHYRLLMPDHSIKYLHAVAHATLDRDNQLEYVAVVQDVTARRLSEEALAKAQSELARVARTTSLGVLTASIAHEVNQPLSGIITNASTCLRMLSADPPNIDGARETARRTIRDGNRASDVITRLRTLYSNKNPQPDLMDLNQAAREVSSLSLSDLQRNRVILRQELAEDLPAVVGDRIQLQQVILNLLRNASDAMSTVHDRPRELLLRTERDEGDRVRLSVKDAGVGLTPKVADKLFEAFYTTKNGGMGIGLSISRSIIEAHHGRLWATSNDGPGATFSFVIPCRPEALADTTTRINRAGTTKEAA